MYPKFHITLGSLFSLILFLIFKEITVFIAIIIFLSTILMDVDHYLYFVFKKKNLSLINAYKWFVRKKEKFRKVSKKKYKRTILIFHGFEFIIILSILTFLNSIFFWVLIGIAIHLFLDYIELISYKKPFYSRVSQLYNLIVNKGRKEIKI